MPLRTPARILGAAAALVLAAAATPAPRPPDAPGTGTGQAETTPGSFSFGVIGDVPYGTAQFDRFPQMVDQLNSQDELRFVAHLGDIKAGSAQCTDEYFAAIKTQFDRFESPLVYTPGDNEWVDCHRVNNGSYNPLERPAALRSKFFATPARPSAATCRSSPRTDRAFLRTSRSTSSAWRSRWSTSRAPTTRSWRGPASG